MTAFFAWHRKHKKYFWARFSDFMLLFNTVVEKFGKKNKFGQIGALERDFSKPRVYRFWVQISEIW